MPWQFQSVPCTVCPLEVHLELSGHKTTDNYKLSFIYMQLKVYEADVQNYTKNIVF